MIARIWKARSTPPRAPEYAAYLRSIVIPELTAIEGYRGITLLAHEHDAVVEVTVITWWESLEAVRAFAGDTINAAVVHERAARMLLDFDRDVTHEEVVFHEAPTSSGQ